MVHWACKHSTEQLLGGPILINFQLKGRLIKHQSADEKIRKRLSLRRTDSFQLCEFHTAAAHTKRAARAWLTDAPSTLFVF